MSHAEPAALEGALQPWPAALPAWRVHLQEANHLYTVQGDWARAHYGLPPSVQVTPTSRRMVSGTGLLKSCFPLFDPTVCSSRIGINGRTPATSGTASTGGCRGRR